MKLYKQKNKWNCSETAVLETHKALYSVVQLWITQEGTAKAVSVCVCQWMSEYVCVCLNLFFFMYSDFFFFFNPLFLLPNLQLCLEPVQNSEMELSAVPAQNFHFLNAARYFLSEPLLPAALSPVFPVKRRHVRRFTGTENRFSALTSGLIKPVFWRIPDIPEAVGGAGQRRWSIWERSGVSGRVCGRLHALLFWLFGSCFWSVGQVCASVPQLFLVSVVSACGTIKQHSTVSKCCFIQWTS